MLFKIDLKDISPKWENKKFITEQLLKHYKETMELIRDNDSHLLSELIDCGNIINVLCNQLKKDKRQLEGYKSYKQLIDHRFDKFFENKDK